MFIMVFEDGSLSKLQELDGETIQGCRDGYCDLIDISDPEDPKVMDEEGQWYSMESV